MGPFRFDVIVTYAPFLLQGALWTLWLTLAVQACVIALAVAAALARLSPRPYLHYPAVAFIDFFRGTPLIIQLYWVHFGLPVLLGRELPSLASAVIALSLNNGAYAAEVVRAGINAIPRGQMLASRGLGMSHALAMRRIILPQALRRTLPPLISGFVDILKGTALVSLIGFPDLMYQAGQANSHSYRSVEIYTAAALGYFVIACPLSILARRYEKGLLARQN
jgi:His/Glu/Gln/Arg/opine family amino acid ABC transporter permease subunit